MISSTGATFRPVLQVVSENKPLVSKPINLLVISDDSDKGRAFIRNFESTSVTVYCVDDIKNAEKALRGRTFNASRTGENAKPTYNGIQFQVILVDDGLNHMVEAGVDLVEEFQNDPHTNKEGMKFFSCSDTYDEKMFGAKIELPSIFSGVVLTRHDAPKAMELFESKK